MTSWRTELRRRTAPYHLEAQHTEALEHLLERLAEEPNPPTAVREPGAAVDRHIADSLVALRVPAVREAGRLADLGSGAGFPGLPLAAALAGASMDLVESARRKADVIERLRDGARITNARVVAERVEVWAAGEGFERYEVVTARALAGLPVVVEYAAPLLRVDGILVAWRGARDRGAEQAGDSAAAKVGLGPGDAVRVRPFPGAHSRHLHVYVKREPTPSRFPRRPGMAAKRPLS